MEILVRSLCSLSLCCDCIDIIIGVGKTVIGEVRVVAQPI